jgi:hypothetical protein
VRSPASTGRKRKEFAIMSAISNATDIANRYIGLWNETDAQRRRALIARAWTEDASYVDPLMKGEGHGGIDAMIAGVQERFPGHRFSLRGDPEGHNDRIRFSWTLVEGTTPVAAGHRLCGRHRRRTAQERDRIPRSGLPLMQTVATV